MKNKIKIFLSAVLSLTLISSSFSVAFAESAQTSVEETYAEESDYAFDAADAVASYKNSYHQEKGYCKATMTLILRITRSLLCLRMRQA